MLVTRDVLQPSEGRMASRPLCPNCGRPMHLSRISPRAGGQPDVRTFGCGECGVWLTEATDDKA